MTIIFYLAGIVALDVALRIARIRDAKELIKLAEGNK